MIEGHATHRRICHSCECRTSFASKVNRPTENGAPKWVISSFRTNGVHCVIPFVSGMVDSVHGIPELVEKGYDSIKPPVAPVDVCTEKRGLYRVTQSRCVPKKKLLHELAVRGITVLLDEYNTSKYCPCGTELTNLCSQTKQNHETKRVRVHKTDGDASCAILALRDDRDELATINMLLIALSTLKGQEWPNHLRRPTSSA